jgi:T5SS/PEP-CTERM-associated repeat protein
MSGFLSQTAWGDITFTGNTINSTDVYVGNTGTGALALSGGATLSDTQGNVGFYSGSNGTVTINYTTWTNSATLTVGYSGTGSLSINGGNASTTYASVGLQAILNSQSTEYFTKKKLS